MNYPIKNRWNKYKYCYYIYIIICYFKIIYIYKNIS